MQLDRDTQRRVLEGLAAAYPNVCGPEDLGFDGSDRSWLQTAIYLHEHGLVEAQSGAMLSEGVFVSSARITARGLDFLADDGGLGAILGVVTVRFEAETLRALLDSRIDSSELPEPEKSKLKGLVAMAGGEALKEGVKQLMGVAFKHGADVWNALQVLAG